MVILQSRIYRADLQANPAVIYVFGDNERRYGFGGQAKEMRGEHNAVGVATLKAPGLFWTEAEAQRQMAVIDADMKPLFAAAHLGRTIVFPLDGIGTGLSELERRSPTTFGHLICRVDALKSLKGEH